MLEDDPFVVLGVAPTASDDDVRKAWLEGVRAHPPEKDPEGFKRIRTAYDAIKDESSRFCSYLFTLRRIESLPDLVDVFPDQIRRVPVREIFDVLSEE